MYKANYTRSTAQHPGFRTNGPRKQELILKANMHIIALRQKGVNARQLLKLLGVTGKAASIPTKKWSGIIGGLKQFRLENGL